MKMVQLPSTQRGMALVLVLFLSTVIVLVSASLLYLSSVKYSLITRSQHVAKGVSISESGIDIALNKIKSRFQNVGLAKLKPDIKFAATAEEIITGTETHKDDNFTIAQDKIYSDEKYYVTGDYYKYNFKDNTTSQVYPIYYRITDKDWVDNGRVSGDTIKKFNIESITQNYRGIWTGITADIEIERKSLFNYGIFFDDDLEIKSNSDLHFDGPIHSNGNILLDTSANITFDSEITAAGHIIRGQKYSSTLDGNVKIKNGNQYIDFTSSNDSIDATPSSPISTFSVDENWKKNALELWDGRLQDHSHEVKNRLSSNPKLLDRNQFYEKNSDLRIITDSKIAGNNVIDTITVYNSSGATLFLKDIEKKHNGNTESVSVNVMGIPNDTFSTTEFTDQREGKNVSVTIIDIEKLQSYQYWPSNNLVYASRLDSKADGNPEDGIADSYRIPNGVFIKNAHKLKNPIIFVSNNPVYIKGDFNKHQSLDGTELSQGNTGFGNSEIDLWKPASVICDALTLLSNSWEGNSFTNASNTEYNFALVAGTVKEDADSGFIPKICRFLENWSNSTAKIRGSLVQLWHSRFATGNWKYGNPVYTTPNLDFNFDSSFKNNTLQTSYYDFFPSTTERIEERDWKKIIDSQSNILKDLKKLSIL